MAANPAPGAEYFTAPGHPNQRRYEALRAYFTEGLTVAEAGARAGYTRSSMASLLRDFRAGRLELFAPPGKPGPKTAPAKDRARARVIQLRREGLSVHEISARLRAEGTPLNRTGAGQILAEEGFGRLLRAPAPEASTSPATACRDTRLPRAAVIDLAAFPARTETRLAGLLLALPDLVSLDLPALISKAGYPGTSVIPAASWLLSLLALKLTGTRRVSHVDDLLTDPASALFAGLAILPKKSALTDYSYRLSHDHQQRFLAALDAKMISSGLATAGEAIFDLDFHAVMHWGHDPVLEKHYVPTRSQRARSVLTFFAQDTGTHNLVYANADISKATQNREVIAFCDHWKQASGSDPHMLIMDQKVTTQAVLGELDTRGVKFATLRMRSASLMKYINGLAGKDYKTITLDRPGPHNRPKVHEDPAVTLTSYPGTVRQLIVTGLGREQPTVIITNDDQIKTRALVAQYARRMTIEQRLAEIIQAFCADALSSTVNLNVDLDVVLCVLAQALLAAFRTRLGPGYATATPDTLQRRFKLGRALRTETTINDTKDFGVAKGLSHLPEMKEIGFTASRRLLDVQRISHDPADGAAALAALTQPVISPAGTRTAGMSLTSPRVQALLSALCVFRLLPHGFTNRDLRTCLAPLLGLDPEAMTSGQITYDLRRIRIHGFIERIPGTFRYQVTVTGIRQALFLTRLTQRLLIPGMAELTDPSPPAPSRLRAAARAYEASLDDLARQAGLAA